MELIIIFIAIAFEVFLMSKSLQYGAIAVFLVFCLIPMSYGINIGIRMNIMTCSIGTYFVCVYLKKKELIKGKIIIRGLVYYFLYVLISSFFATMLSPYPEDFIRNILAFVINFIMMAFLLNYVPFTPKGLKRINYVIAIWGIIVGLYGILNYVIKINPYLVLMSSISGVDASSEFFMEEERAFLQGRVSSFFSHPLLLGQISIIMFSYGLFSLKLFVNSFLRWTCLFLLILMCILCGSRSALVPIVLTIIIYLVYEGRKKTVKYFLFFSVLVFGISVFLPSKYHEAAKGFFYIWDDSYAKEANIKGSNFEMRLNQVGNGLYIIEDNPLFGLGQGYVSQHGSNHEEMLGYESYILQFLVDGGIIGVLFFTFFYFYLYIYLFKQCHHSRDRMKVHALCLSYYINILLTGIQTGTFSIYMIFFFLLRASINHNINKTTPIV